MSGLIGPIRLEDLTPVPAEAGAAEGDPRLVYSWTGASRYDTFAVVRSYTPSDGGAPRLVALVGDNNVVGVWETGTGAFLGGLQGPNPDDIFPGLVTYRRPSDGRPRMAAVFVRGELRIWDGDDLQVLHTIHTNAEAQAMYCLAVYDDPTSGRTRLVTG
jgi:hypothetical protein